MLDHGRVCSCYVVSDQHVERYRDQDTALTSWGDEVQGTARAVDRGIANLDVVHDPAFVFGPLQQVVDDLCPGNDGLQEEEEEKVGEHAAS